MAIPSLRDRQLGLDCERAGLEDLQFHVQGEVFLFNGQDGRHLTTFDDPYPHQGSSFGYSIASPGDINGDKIPENDTGANVPNCTNS